MRFKNEFNIQSQLLDNDNYDEKIKTFIAAGKQETTSVALHGLISYYKKKRSEHKEQDTPRYI